MLDELQGGVVSRTYSYGLELISQKLVASSSQLSFYGFDGHGSVRFLTDRTGAITDTYDYDAFGILISHTGTTANNYLFAGEQFDPALGIYYNRARYYDQRLGRFWSMDTWEGDARVPGSLDKYLYNSNTPVNRRDPSGHFDSVEVQIASTISLGIEAGNIVAGQNIFLGALQCLRNPHADCGQSITAQYIAFVIGLIDLPQIGSEDPFRSELAASVNGWVQTNWYFPSIGAEDYQGQISGRPGWGYYKDGVEFDGLRQNTLVEAKYNYGKVCRSEDGGVRRVVDKWNGRDNRSDATPGPGRKRAADYLVLL